MPAPVELTSELIDLKLLPAWVKETESRYADFEGDVEARPDPSQFSPRQRGPRRDRPRRERERNDKRSPRKDERRGRPPQSSRLQTFRPPAPEPSLPQVTVRFLPESAAFENVAAQIRSEAAAYSIYALARLFLQKPERYAVHLVNEQPMFRLEGSGLVATSRGEMESSAFRTLKNQYYRTDVTLTEPVKGNFASVARERSSGTLLGPTNHHSYQPTLRRLYEQRFSRRTSFPDFQRQIEIVSDPAVVELWKESSRQVTAFVTLKEDAEEKFASEAEAERHFREKYLPGMISETREVVIDGVSSRNLPDRALARAIEFAWSKEVRSPSHLMQELSARFRAAGLQIFRHRKGMLFVSSIRPKPIDEAAVSESVRRIVDALKTGQRVNRKDLATKVIGPDVTPEEAEKMKLSLVSELRWLIREGHVIEFNDGTLDLPRSKPPSGPAKNMSAPPVESNEANHSPTTLSDGSVPS